MDPQPTDNTGGATCLHAIYRYYQHPLSLEEIIAGVERTRSGGTLAPLLGIHALKQHFDVVIYVHNLKLFDPSWFKNPPNPPTSFLIEKLRLGRAHQQHNAELLQASQAFEKYLEAGGEIQFKVLTPALINHHLQQGTPLLTGLSATYLYGIPRERDVTNKPSVADDIQGKPAGHFVVLCEYNEADQTISVADPLESNPISKTNYYQVPVQRLLNAILLGVFTYDANLMVISPKK